MTSTSLSTYRPSRLWRAAAGVAAAAAAVGVGHGVAALINPAASPLLAIGSVLIDAAPTPAKEFAVRTFGTADKPVLLSAIAVVLVGLAAVIGLLAWNRRRTAMVGIALLGVAGFAAAVVQGGILRGVPSVAAGLTGIATLHWLTRCSPLRESSERRAAPSATESPAEATPPAASGASAHQPASPATTGTSAHQPASPATTGSSGRRAFLIALGGTALLGVAGGAAGVIGDHVRRGLAAARRLVKLPAPESPVPPLPAGVELDVAGLPQFITPNENFYRVDISLITPRVDPSTWTLTIDGMVDRPLRLSYEDLLALPMIERDITLSCVSNEVGGSYVSTGRWLGVPFSEIIRRVGVQPGVDQVFSSSSDSGFTCSTPYQAVSDGRDAMIVVGMNGEVLPDARGFPARMLVPGLFGFVSATKWLERIEFTTYDRRTAYWTERGWATDAPVLTQARINVPASLSTVPRSNAVLAGVAWAQHRGIAKVEISIDGGDWQPATLASSGGIDLWRQWSYRYDGPPGLHSAQVRATDNTGTTQPEQRRKVFPAGATGWHQIQFTVE